MIVPMSTGFSLDWKRDIHGAVEVFLTWHDDDEARLHVDGWKISSKSSFPKVQDQMLESCAMLLDSCVHRFFGRQQALDI